MHWRPHYFSRIEFFVGGITLTATLGYAISGSVYGVAATLFAAALLVADAVRRGACRVFGSSRSGSARRCPDSA